MARLRSPPNLSDKPFARLLRVSQHKSKRGCIVETIRFLGPENCALSIVEGNSGDGTPEVLAAIRPEIEALGTEYFFQSSDVNPKEGEGQRIL
ncbi:hypothetical protein VM1G_11763 [Cytospora mali]|uniref:Uncharacterized protein n=1 Tax=Cytospora mali TaxID=578113 RepID=A0A194W4R5_CYTMA|nr:hypothetical protein VM1G_11763 [Valsa mali]